MTSINQSNANPEAHCKNPLSIRVPSDGSDGCIDLSKSGHTPLLCPPPPSPTETTQIDARKLFEQASNAFNNTKIALREEWWDENAPNKHLYAGKRNKHGFPDKRTKAGKMWFYKLRETELTEALQKVVDKCNSFSWRGSK
jgi:hypothetical protein